MLALGLALALCACGDDEGGKGPLDSGGEDEPDARIADAAMDAMLDARPPVMIPDATVDSGPRKDAGKPPDAEADAVVPDPCPPLEERERVELFGEIRLDTEWTCDKLYVITIGSLYVVDDATLTIGLGTVVQVGALASLIITRGSRLEVQGTADWPVVFTSAQEPGMRAPGDWGGVLLLGNAPTNATDDDPADTALPGFDFTDERNTFGGDDEAWDCGHLSYLRIEHGGSQGIDGGLPGLLLAGCGSDTRVSYAQVHRSVFDGLGVHGGAPELDHIVLSDNGDNALQVRFGAQPKIQFLIVRVPLLGAAAFELENQVHADEYDATPRSRPEIWNATLFGARDERIDQPGIVLSRGTAASLHNLIVTGFFRGAIDLRILQTADVALAIPPGIVLESSLFFDNGEEGTEHFGDDDVDATDDDGAFSEQEFFSDAALDNLLDEDPLLSDPTHPTAPDFMPDMDSPAADGQTPTDGFDRDAAYMGALEPGGDDWTAGFTDYPED